ncbi:MAG: sulfur carrier protein ThiS [Bdellovibrionota bacterium]
MRVMVNGEGRDVQTNLLLSELLRTLEMDKPYVAVSVNMNCIPKLEYANLELKENDEVEILVPYQGG